MVDTTTGSAPLPHHGARGAVRGPTLAAPRARMRVATHVVLWCCAALVCHVAVARAQVSVHTLQDTSPIDRSLVNAPSPRMPDPDDAAQEKAMEKLRAAAQNAPASARGKNTPPSNLGGEPSPRDAAWLLGLMALHGKAMAADPVQAQHWFERAYLLGHPMAPAGLAWCQIDGCGGNPNPELARTWIERLRKVEPGRALFLEWLLANQLAPLDIAQPGPLHQPQPAPNTNPASHRTLLLRAAQAGDSNALNELGLENVASGRTDMAMRQFQAAARQSDAAAHNASLLAERIEAAKTGSVTVNTSAQSTAHTWWLQARKYHRGEGVPANYTEAMRLYQQAAAKGSREAQHMLELIYSRPVPQGGVDIAWMQQLAALQIGPDGAVLPQARSSGPPLFTRDPTPLYDLLPSHWRTAPSAMHPAAATPVR